MFGILNTIVLGILLLILPVFIIVALFQKISWRRDLKFAAREKFTGNAWTKLSFSVLGLLLVNVVISSFMSMLPFGILFFNVLFAGFLTYGVIDVANKIKRGEDFSFSDFFVFQDLSRVVLLTIIQNIYLFGWSLLFVVPGIVKSFSYSQTFFILCENPTMPTDEIILQSRQMMDGHKWELFILKASFVGWAILATFTFGIAGLYIVPLYIMSLYMFHDYVKKGYYKSRKHDNVYTIYN